MNRPELTAAIKNAINQMVASQGSIAPIDLLVKLGYLKTGDVTEWRMKRMACLETKISCNLGKVNFILCELARFAREDHLKPSFTGYVSWGRGPKIHLRFSKSGIPNLEHAYSTHYVKRPESSQAEGGVK